MLRVLPSRERVAEQLRVRVREQGAALALGLIDLRSLEDRLLRASGLTVVGATEARLALAAVAPAAARGTTLSELASQPSFAEAFLELWDALRRAGIEAESFMRLAERLSGRRSPGGEPSLTGRRLAALAGIAAAYEERLAARSVFDGAGARLRLPAKLAVMSRERMIGLLDGANVLEIDGLAELSVVRARMLQAIAWVGVRVRVIVPEVPPALGMIGSELVSALELARRALLDEAPAVEVIARPLAGPRANPLGRVGVLPFVAAGQARSLVDPQLRQRVELIDAGDVRAELRGVCAAIRELLHRGVAPHQITIAVPRLAWHRQRIVAALDAAELPWEELRQRPLLQHAAPLRLALTLIEAAERQLPREELAVVLESAYVARRGAAALIQALREAGSRDDRPPGHLARLRQHAARLQSHPSESRQARALRVFALADDWDKHFERLRLPLDATLADHLDALFAALRTLGVPHRCLSLPGVGLGARERRFERDAIAALARDRQALEALEVAGHGLVEAAEAVGIAEQRISLTDFRGHLEAALGGLASPPAGVRGSGIALRDLAEFAGASTDYLFILHAVEGELPGPGRSVPFLDDDDRQVLDRAAGRPVLPQPGLADATAFALASAGANERIVLSCHRQDAEGRELLRSRWFIAVRDALSTPELVHARELEGSVVPALALCSTRGQVLTRLNLLAATDDPAADHRVGASLLELAQQARPELRSAIAWIHDHARDPIRAQVRLEGRALSLAHRVLEFDWSPAPPRDQPPLRVWQGSATALEHYAACPFRFFAGRVLRLRPRPSPRDDLDALEQGEVRHLVLAEVMQELRRVGLTPLQGGEQTWRENQVALEICDLVLDRWQERERIGPRPLWLLHRDLIRRDLLRLLEGERRNAIEAWEPGEFERGFGLPDPNDKTRNEGEPLRIPDRSGRRVFELVGRVDRVDYRGDGREREGLVIDYKSGRVGDRLRYDQIARTQLQLPLYAAWLARVRPELSYTDAAYVSLRDGERSQVSLLDLAFSSMELDGLLDLDPERRHQLRERALSETASGHSAPGGLTKQVGAPRVAAGAVDLPTTGGRNLADNVWALLEGIGEGRFDVRPVEPGRTCSFCSYAPVCRVERSDESGGDDSDEAGPIVGRPVSKGAEEGEQ